MNYICYAIIDPKESVISYMDLMGWFPRKLLRGNKSMLLGYHYDANYIRAILIKNRRGATIIEAWEKLYLDFKKAGAAPQTYVLDNKKSKDLLDSFIAENIQY